MIKGSRTSLLHFLIGGGTVVFIIIGSLSFILFAIFDLNKIKYHNSFLNKFFVIGVILLAISTIGILLGNSRTFQVMPYLQVLGGIMAAVFFLLMIYSLFFSLPFQNTYVGVNKDNSVVDSGMYSLCRHPGVLWFALFYLFLWLASGKTLMMWAWIIWTMLNILLVYGEDSIIFPEELSGYDEYKRRVPFLIPNNRSINKCISSLYWGIDTNGKKTKSVQRD